ncbi:MAG: single-stranded DNA-binding protein [Flavobacteriaceae bacterium]|nr:single-stranded DNA-binding protein [Flavobacteriaceae bacterium]
MNTLRNNVQLIGHLGQKPEIITLESGKKLAKFSIATNENFINAQGKKVEKTDWHNIIAWNKTAELAEMFLDKGKQIALSGKLSQRTWDDKDGNKRYITEIICNELVFLGVK